MFRKRFGTRSNDFSRSGPERLKEEDGERATNPRFVQTSGGTAWFCEDYARFCEDYARFCEDYARFCEDCARFCEDYARFCPELARFCPDFSESTLV